MKLVEKILTTRTELELRIKDLGGKLPARWAHDTDGQYRNLQLLELVEDLERKGRNDGRQS